jgi:hypothetical protein
MMKVPSLLSIVGVAQVDDDVTFYRMLEKVLLMSSMLMTKVPSPKCWRRYS